MKKELTVTFSIDNVWDDIDIGKQRIDDEDSFLAYAMDVLRSAIIGHTEEFEKAELDGNLLFSKDGNAPENVKRLSGYTWVLEELKDEVTFP